MPSKFRIARFTDLPAQECPCGTSRRAFVDDAGQVASIHVVEVTNDSRTHYHKRLTEIYYVLEGSGELELEGQRHSVQAGDAVLIKPGCRHRAIGKLKVLNTVVPAFDPEDEWFD